MPRAILFDLDDTLFDHSHCAREALAGVHRLHACFTARPFEELARAHAEHLEALHLEVLAGTLGIDAARQERFRRLLLSTGGDPALAADVAAVYRDAYKAARRPVAGAADLLALLCSQAPIVIVSNNLLAEQREKLEQCGFAPYISALVVSEEAGISKPDPEIFAIALRAVDVRPSDAVMVGDSWAADIAGALAAGIVPIWFNPKGRSPAGPPDDIVQLRALAPAHDAVHTILSAYAGRANRD